MIPLKFGLFHSGCPLSYLRYMTFKTLRFFHPNEEIELYVSNKFKKTGYKWNREHQDFETNIDKDYLDQLGDLNVKIVEGDFFEQYPPNYQSDFFRWWWLRNNGGFYLDTDQICLKNCGDLPLDKEFIYCKYFNPQCGDYCAAGVIGADKNSNIVEYITKVIQKYYNPNDYNSLGPWMLRSVLEGARLTNSFNAPRKYFYPIPYSDLVGRIFSGKADISSKSYFLHWFGGHPLSQQFNKIYTEEFAKKSNDTISKFLREKEII